MKKNRICELLSIKYPIIQGPMSWISDAVLAAAVSNAGGIGIIGPNAGAKTITKDVIETAERLRAQIKLAKSLTSKPFGVNLMCLKLDNFTDDPFSDEIVKVILDEGIALVCSCGNQPEKYTKRLKADGIKVIHRDLPISNIETAKRAEQAGIDAFVAVGFDGGGHVGGDRIPTFAFIPQIVDALKIPVIAGGGIVDGRGMVAAMALGAEAIYLGTKFIATKECPAHSEYKQALLNAKDTSTVTFPGMFHMLLRALKTPIIEEYMKLEASGKATPEDNERLHRHEKLPWIYGGGWDITVFPCNATVGMIKEIKSAEQVVNDIIKEADKVLRNLY